MTDFKHVVWYPIETAPKDGTEILVFYDKKIGVASWMDEADLQDVDSDNLEQLTEGWYEKNFYNHYYDTYYLALNPTYWTPLPNPPEDL